MRIINDDFKNKVFHNRELFLVKCDSQKQNVGDKIFDDSFKDVGTANLTE